MATPKAKDIPAKMAHHLSLLQAGSTVTIELVTPAGQRAKLRTCFVGYLPERYILIQMPSAEKLGKYAVHIKQGLQVTVRGLLEGKEGQVVAFTSRIKQTLQIPSRLLVLDFPEQVGLQNLRQNIRIAADIQALLNLRNTSWRAHINDLSAAGCQLSVHANQQLLVSVGEQIDLVIEQYQQLVLVKLSAVVCNYKQMGELLALGVKFQPECHDEAVRLLHAAVTAELG